MKKVDRAAMLRWWGESSAEIAHARSGQKKLLARTPIWEDTRCGGVQTASLLRTKCQLSAGLKVKPFTAGVVR